MAGKSKGKFFCWRAADNQLCPNLLTTGKLCGVNNVMVSHPHVCRSCGGALDYHCRFKLFPHELCRVHRGLPEGPPAVSQRKLALGKRRDPVVPAFPGIPQEIASRMPAHVRPLFAHYLNDMSLADGMRTLAARAMAMVDQKIREGISEDSVHQMLKTAGDLTERAAKVHLMMKEAQRPTEFKDAYDYSRLSPTEGIELERLLSKAAIPLEEDAGARPGRDLPGASPVAPGVTGGAGSDPQR